VCVSLSMDVSYPTSSLSSQYAKRATRS
jgi:hypothetical protein